MTSPGILTMSRRELDRAEWMQRVHEQRMTQAQAAERLGLSIRQVERLYRAYKAGGAAALLSKKRGRPSLRRLSDGLRAEAVRLVRDKYGDFGPTLAREKLAEVHGLVVSVETLRQWMISDGVWLPRNRRLARPHQPRSRRPCLGELVQIDGCDHEWFEDRAPRCVLLVYVDDATSRLMQLRFVQSESAFDYFSATRSYVARHGRPVAFYSDKHSVFRGFCQQDPIPASPHTLCSSNVDCAWNGYCNGGGFCVCDSTQSGCSTYLCSTGPDNMMGNCGIHGNSCAGVQSPTSGWQYECADVSLGPPPGYGGSLVVVTPPPMNQTKSNGDCTITYHTY
jgi:transposase